MMNAIRMPQCVLLVAFLALAATPAVWSSPEEAADSIRALNREGEVEAARAGLKAIEEDASWVTLLRAETEWHAGYLYLARKQIDKIRDADDPSWIGAQELLVRIEFLEGKIEACRSASSALLFESPGNSTATWFLAACYLRTGAYDKALELAEGYVELAANPIASRALHAEVLEAIGNVEEARKIRRSIIPILNASNDLTSAELIAGSRALRALGEYEAANQCVQLAQDFDITDPYMKLEKIRLYRATQGYGIAEKTAFELTKFYATFPMAFAEWANIKWDMRVKEEDVSLLTKRALEGDPTLLDTRCRLIFYAMLKDDPEERDALIDQNLDIDSRHRGTRNLLQAARYLENNDELGPVLQDDPDFARVMSNLMTAKNDYQESLRWATAYADAQPESPYALHELGRAKFRTGAYEEARALLERALTRDPYSLQTRNLLSYMDEIVDNAETDGGTIRVFYPGGEEALASFAEARSAQILAKESKAFDTELQRPLRIQLCTDLNDLAVITDGIPFGCCVDPAHPTTTGVVNFDDTMFLWTPKAAGGKRRNYRWDEALHRGIVQALIRSATNDKAPLWLLEGVSGHALWRENPEWAPANLGLVVSNLDRGLELPVSDLAAGFLGSKRPFYQVYAPLLIQDWTERFGEAAIQKILAEIATGATWTAALESALGQPIEVIDEESRASILSRYEALAESTQEAALDARALFDAGNVEFAAAAVVDALHRNPYDQSGQQLIFDLIDALSAGREKSDVYFRLLEATLVVQRSDADARYQLATWHHENGRDKEALAHCQSAVGIRPGWLAVHRLLADVALELDQYDAAYASLATLHEARPKHVKILERLIVCADALDMKEEATRWTSELQVLAAKANS